jgi:hypothetical protein
LVFEHEPAFEESEVGPIRESARATHRRVDAQPGDVGSNQRDPDARLLRRLGAFVKQGERFPEGAPSALPGKVLYRRRQLFHRGQGIRPPNDEVTRGDQIFEAQAGSELAPQARGRADAQASHVGDIRLPEPDSVTPHSTTLRCSTWPLNGDIDLLGRQPQWKGNAPELSGGEMAEVRVGRRLHRIGEA